VERSATIVLVHGAWHGAWAWESVAAALGADGFDVRTVDLPSSGPDSSALGDLRDDVRAVREAVEAVDGPVVLVAHSYGGAPVTEAAAGLADVAHIVYLTAFMLDAGESLFGLVGGRAPDWWIDNGDGSLGVAGPEEIFYNDCSPEVAAASVARLHPQSRASAEQPVEAVAWRDVPTTYVVCERDNAIPVPAQEMLSQRAGTVRRLDASHSPFLSRPDEVVAIIREAAGA
jgi:pimeloyl-ACP methyl ester carboxylesterase